MQAYRPPAHPRAAACAKDHHGAPRLRAHVVSSESFTCFTVYYPEEQIKPELHNKPWHLICFSV